MVDDQAPYEVELKLRLAKGDLARLARDPLLKDHAAAKPTTRTLVSTYFDTQDRFLRRHGVVVRVRRIAKRRVQCVKRAPDHRLTLRSRVEFEHDLIGDHPELDRIADPALRTLFADRRVRDGLGALFTTHVRRQAFLLDWEGSRLELALDQGEIRAGDSREAICEAEIELKSGGVGAIYDLARAIQRIVPFAVEGRAKSDRGYDLIAGARPVPARAERLRLPASATVGEAFALIGRHAIAHLMANEASVRLDRAGEGVHQMRVAIRRLRSALTAFRALLPADERRRIAASVKWIADRCARAREWDVFQATLIKPLHDRLPDESALAQFDKTVEAARIAAYRGVSRLLASPRYADTLLRLAAYFDGGEWREHEGFDGPANVFARKTLRRLHRRVHRHGDRLATLDQDQLHELRIEAKKLRYVGEFLGGLFERRAVKAYLTALIDVQECLGSLNDAASTGELMRTIERRAPRMDRALLARATGLVVGWSEARVETDLKRLPEAWAAFAAVKPFWK